MELVGAAIALVTVALVSRQALRTRVRRRDSRLREAADLRLLRRAAAEDITLFGEELARLHEETLADPLDEQMRADYQSALDSYERAKAQLGSAAAPTDVTEVTTTLADGRFAQACVLAARDGTGRPERRPPCFFDPAHGPASTEVSWAPPGGVEREIPVCFRDAERLDAGEQPRPRMVRLGNRWVPWYASGPTYEAWAAGWYGALAGQGRADANRLTMMFSGGASRFDAGLYYTTAAWVDPGSWDQGGIIGGHDFTGYEGGGGFDGGGGGDGGGGDGGGGGGD